MDELYSLYTFLDLAGTFAFVISGATAARRHKLDLFEYGPLLYRGLWWRYYLRRLYRDNTVSP